MIRLNNKLIYIAIVLLCLMFLIGSFKKPRVKLEQAQSFDVRLNPIPLGEYRPIYISKELTFDSAYVIDSDLHYFGGWSGLNVSDDLKSFVAVNDSGFLWRGEINWSFGNKAIKSITNSMIDYSYGVDYVPLALKGFGDLEAIRKVNDLVLLSYESPKSGVFVGKFDSQFGTVLFKELPRVAALQNLPKGYGIEAATFINISPSNDNVILAMAERDPENQSPYVPAWFIDTSGKVINKDLFYSSDGYSITDIDSNSTCGTFILQRKLSLSGFYTRISKVVLEVNGNSLFFGATEKIFEGKGWGVIDNMEGISVVKTSTSGCKIFAISDSNYMPFQKNILLVFEYNEEKNSFY